MSDYIKRTVSPKLFVFVVRPMELKFDFPETFHYEDGYMIEEVIPRVKDFLNQKGLGYSATVIGTLDLNTVEEIGKKYKTTPTVVTATEVVAIAEPIVATQTNVDLFGRPAVYLLEQLITMGRVREEELSSFQSVIKRLKEQYEIPEVVSKT